MISKHSKILLFFLVSNIVFLYITPIMFAFDTNTYPIYYYILRGFLILLSIFLFIKIIYIIIKNTNSKYKQGILSFVTIFVLFFYTFELFFTFFAQTNGLNNTYTSTTWKYKYWKLNYQGFRDDDFRDLTASNKPILFFVGDSYTEGHGIKNVEDRYTNVVRKNFSELCVLNLGKCGTDIHDHIKIIQNAPLKPKYVFLQICSNDWDYLKANNNNISYLFANNILHAGFDIDLSKYSVFINYLKSNFENILNNFLNNRVSQKNIEKAFIGLKIDKKLKKSAPKDNIEFLEFCYKNSNLSIAEKDSFFLNISKLINPNIDIINSKLFDDYLQKINMLNDFCAKNQIEFYVIPFPSFDKTSIQLFEKIPHNLLLNKLNAQNVKTIDILPILKHANLKNYTVNRYDAHANSESNKIIGEHLSKYIRKNILIN